MEPSPDDRHETTADALANMADGIHEEPAGFPPQDPPADPAPADESLQAGADPAESPFEQSGDQQQEDWSAPQPRRRNPAARRPAQPTQFHYVAAQLSVAMGILLLVPVILSVLILAGAVSIGRTGSSVPVVMLILATPLSLVMLFGGLWYGKHLKRFRQNGDAQPQQTDS